MNITPAQLLNSNIHVVIIMNITPAQLLNINIYVASIIMNYCTDAILIYFLFIYFSAECFCNISPVCLSTPWSVRLYFLISIGCQYNVLWLFNNFQLSDSSINQW